MCGRSGMTVEAASVRARRSGEHGPSAGQHDDPNSGWGPCTDETEKQRWHPFEQASPSAEFGDLVRVLDADSTGIFWGSFESPRTAWQGHRRAAPTRSPCTRFQCWHPTTMSVGYCRSLNPVPVRSLKTLRNRSTRNCGSRARCAAYAGWSLCSHSVDRSQAVLPRSLVSTTLAGNPTV